MNEVDPWYAGFVAAYDWEESGERATFLKSSVDNNGNVKYNFKDKHKNPYRNGTFKNNGEMAETYAKFQMWAKGWNCAVEEFAPKKTEQKV